MNHPSLRQADTLRAMWRHHSQYGEWPTIVELGALLGVTNQTVGARLRALQRDGWTLQKAANVRGKHRGWTLTPKALGYINEHRNWRDFWAEVDLRQAEFTAECVELKSRGVFDVKWDSRRQTFTAHTLVCPPWPAKKVELEAPVLDDLAVLASRAGWTPDEAEAA